MANNAAYGLQPLVGYNPLAVILLAEVDEDFQRLLVDRASLEAHADATIATVEPGVRNPAAVSTQAYGDYEGEESDLDFIVGRGHGSAHCPRSQQLPYDWLGWKSSGGI